MLLAIIYIAASFWTTRRAPATGDEVGYVMTADSLLHGEWLELTARWRVVDDADYSPGEPIPFAEFIRTTAPSLARAGNYPLHDLASSVLILPFLALGGRNLVVVLIALAMAGAVALGVRTAEALGAARSRAVAGGVITGLSVPALTYSGQIFPDAVVALPIAVLIASGTGALPRRLAPFALAMLPLLHVRFWLLALGFALALLVTRRYRFEVRELFALALPTAVGVTALALVDLAVYGVGLPHAGWLLFFQERRETIETYAGAAGIAGLFVDRAFGLLPAAPVAAFLFFGAGRALRRAAERAFVLAVVPYLVVVPFIDWTGGFSPQSRYLAPLVPLLPLLYAHALGSPRPLLWLGGLFGIWTAGQSAIYVVAPWLRYDFYSVAPLADKGWLRFNLPAPSRMFPSFGTEGATLPLAIAWCGALLALLLGGLLLRTGEARPPALDAVSVEGGVR